MPSPHPSMLPLLLGLGCGAPELYGVRAPLGGAVAQTRDARPAPRVLSAHFSRAPVGEAGELLLVFSKEIDPTSLAPEAFLVMQERGDFAVPQRAVFDPAAEYDENRTVTLVGAFGRPEQNPPTAVRIIGGVYAEDGTAFEGLDADVRPHDMPDEIVWIELLRPDVHRCAGAGQVVRSYWSDNLRGVEAEDLALIRVAFTDGREATPSAFDDHADLGGRDPVADDNVLDLCLAGEAPVSALSLPAGAFSDTAGHASAATTRGPAEG